MLCDSPILFLPWGVMPSNQSRSKSLLPSQTTWWEPARRQALVWALGIRSERCSLGPAPQSL